MHSLAKSKSTGAAGLEGIIISGEEAAVRQATKKFSVFETMHAHRTNNLRHVAAVRPTRGGQSTSRTLH